MADIEEFLAANDPMSTPVMALDGSPLASLPQQPQVYASKPDAMSRHTFGDRDVTRDADFARNVDAPNLASRRFDTSSDLPLPGTQQEAAASFTPPTAKRSRRRGECPVMTGGCSSGRFLAHFLDSLTQDARHQQMILLFCICMLVLIPHSQRILQNTLPILKSNTTAMMVLNSLGIAVAYYYACQFLL